MRRRAWRSLMRELARRGAGVKESGAFLCARPGSRRIRHVAYYDDLDATCLTGGISFSGTGYSRLWAMCRDRGLTVIADIHTHPGHWVEQSSIDSANPMIATVGHVAIIAPLYATTSDPTACGVHVYAGSGKWCSAYGSETAQVLRLQRIAWPAKTDITALAGALLTRLRQYVKEARDR